MAVNSPDDSGPDRAFACRIQGPKRAPTLFLAGDADMAAVPALAAAGARLADDSRLAVLRVDCAAVTFFDCSALRVLLDMDAHISARGRAVCWRHVPECMLRVLELTRTAGAFAVVD